jgi:hypothetical protein
MTVTYRASSLYPIEVELDWNTTDFGTGVVIGTLPNGCRIMFAEATVQTQFNAASTNLLNIGYSGSGTEICTGVSIGVAANTLITLPQAKIANPLTADRTIYARFTQSGTAASAGKLHISILAAL